MILALFIGFFMVSLILFVIGFKYWNPNKSRASKFLFEHDAFFQNLGSVMMLINGIIVLIILLGLSCTYASAGANAEKLKEEYKAILYKANSDDFGLSNKEVVDEIQEWNMTLVYYQEMRKNIWIRIFYPDVYGEMDTIEYENLKISKE